MVTENHPPVLRAEGLRKAFKGRVVVNDVAFTVGAGEIVGLLGPNGAGKSTAFNLTAGLLPADGGSVWLNGQDLGGLPLYRRAQLGLGYLPQDSTVFRGVSVRANFAIVLEGMGLGTGAKLGEEIDRVIADYDLAAVQHSHGGLLSGGERRRVEMARTLLRNPRVVLLDEPFAGVDPIAVHEIKRFVVSIRDRGIGVLITDHNVRESLKICDRAYLISEGRIILDGKPQDIVRDTVARETYLGQDFEL